MFIIPEHRKILVCNYKTRRWWSDVENSVLIELQQVETKNEIENF